MLELLESTEDVREAVAAGRTLEIVGGGTKRKVSLSAAERHISLRKMDRVLDYQPEELVLTVQAGARLADLEKLVAGAGQMLPFEPPHLAGVLGAEGQATIGGTVAANLSGPRRIRAGAARDHVLGFAGVTGRGEVFKAGGKVVKNVTGYDLSKLMAGSWGTLAVMTEITLKVLPAARSELTLMFFGLDDRRANEAMTKAMGSAAEVSGAAHLPAYAAGRPPLSGEMAVTALRLEGFEASVQARAEALAALLTGYGRLQQLEGALSAEFWAGVREVEAFKDDARPLWRLSVPPAAGWKLGEALIGDLLYDWAGGLAWLLPDPSLDAAAIRSAVRGLGGHATLMRGEGGPAFEPLEGPLAALSARVKAAFDPQGLLNPGRMVPLA